jgi:formate hydrogenlyase transcriptional activator
LTQKRGRFEIADRGTLFFDEIGDISLDLQPKLLRALHKHEFERLGSTKTIRVDVRLIAATHRDLPAMIHNNQPIPGGPLLPAECVPNRGSSASGTT